MTSQLTPRTTILLTMPPLMWACNAVVGRLAVGTLPPITMNALRWVVAFILLLPLAYRVLQKPKVFQGRMGYFALLGLFGMGSYNALQYMALHTSTPLNVTLIASSAPVWMLGVGAVIYRVKPTAREIYGAILSLLGVIVVVSRGEWQALARIQFVQGDALMLLAIFTWALYSWLLARPPKSMQGAERPNWDWAHFLMAQVLFGLVWCSAFSGIEWAVLGTPAYLAEIKWSLWVPALLLFIAVGPSLIAYRCWGLGVATVGPSIAGFFSNLTPIFAALLSTLMLGQAPRPYHALAFALIVGGIWVSSRGKRATT